MTQPLRRRLRRLPERVAKAKQFLLWKHKWSDRRNTLVKVPYYIDGSPRKDELDTPADLRRLSSLNRALAAYEAAGDRYDGVGLALVGNGIAAFDLDKCLGPDGVLLPDHPGHHVAREAEKAGAYIEVSPSGRGLRILGTSDNPQAYSRDGVEYWGQGRYVTVTGNLWANPRGWRDLSALRGSLRERERKVDRRAEEDALVTSRVIRELRDALSSMSSDERDLWVRMGHALKTLGDRGKELWVEWSRKSKKWDAKDAEGVWESFRPSSTGYKAVFAEAQQEWGWINPRKRKRSGDPQEDEKTEGDEEDDRPLNLLDYAIDLGDHRLLPTEFVLDGFLPVGVSLVAGSWGAGKSTNLLPLFASVAHLTPEDWGFHPVLRRPVVWVTEAPGQARDVLYSLSKAEGSASWSEIKEWLFVVPAHRTPVHKLAGRVQSAVEELTYTLDNGFAVRPVVVLDTTSANLDLENESDNSEVGEVMARLKEFLPGVPLVLVGHTPKAARTNPEEATFRGAGAWEADAVATYFLIHDKETSFRYMVIGKIRFDPDYTEVSFGKDGGRELVKTEWGETQSKAFIHGVPCKSSAAARRLAQEDDDGEEEGEGGGGEETKTSRGGKRKVRARERMTREALTERQTKLLEILEGYGGSVSETTLILEAKSATGSNQTLVKEALARLVELGEVRVADGLVTDELVGGAG